MRGGVRKHSGHKDVGSSPTPAANEINKHERRKNNSCYRDLRLYNNGRFK